MSYTALYRKFRPVKFDEIVGQEHITKTIKNQIIANRVGHAYLFTGGRGTGKTSAAKILARAVNCLNLKDGEPCNECEICKSAINGSLTDIVEMDAASNNSVEDIRSIREEVNFLPTLAKYRVYIIDEAHMLSTGAFNALLKTLEEPPQHVKFILATTEPQKIPATILSRCQRFDFKKISVQNITERLQKICKEINIEITEEALKIISILSDGALRDGISILERCIQDGETKITEEKIKDLVGIPSLTYIEQIVESILNYDVTGAINVIQEIENQGKDITNFLWEIIKYIQAILIYKTTKKTGIYSKEEIDKIENLSKIPSTERLLMLINTLSELENQIKQSNQKQLIFQVGIIKACNKYENIGYEEIEKRLEKIEQKIENGIIEKQEPKQEIKQTEKKIATKKDTEKKEDKTTKEKSEIKTIEQDGKQYVPYWDNVIKKLKDNGKLVLYTNLMNTKATEINDMTIGIEFANGLTSFGKTVIQKPENMQELEKIVLQECGKEMRIKLIENETPKQNNKSNSIADLDIPINIIDE